jgi:hypothetical protein
MFHGYYFFDLAFSLCPWYRIEISFDSILIIPIHRLHISTKLFAFFFRYN